MGIPFGRLWALGGALALLCALASAVWAAPAPSTAPPGPPAHGTTPAAAQGKLRQKAPRSTASANQGPLASPSKAKTTRGKKSPSKSAKRASKSRASRKKASRGRKGKTASKSRKRSRRKARRPKRKPRPRRKGSKPGQPDESVRRLLTARYDSPAPVESPELKAMRDTDELLFPRAGRGRGAPWAIALPPRPGELRVDASGLPVPGATLTERPAETAADLSWLSALKLPDIPVRWDPSIVRYLEYYKNHPKGRHLVSRWIQKSGRYRAAIAKLLRQYRMPDDVLWLAMIESAFEPEAYSWAGAAGLWQFMPATGRIYGLTVTRRIDERLDPERSTHAALRHLNDLHQRFGSWDLAFAAYNMGYGGLLSSIRKYNTNDYWELRRLEAALPYETALYVPKIVALAVVANNCDVFGCAGVKLDEPKPFAPVAVGPGTTLNAVAEAAGVKPEVIAKLNPHLRGTRTPPLELSVTPRRTWTVYVPMAKAERVKRNLEHGRESARAWTTHRVRWGEPIEHIAQLYGTSVKTIERLNDLPSGVSPRPESVVFVPRKSGAPPAAASSALLERPVAVVPDHDFHKSEHRRAFFQVIQGDTLSEVARACGVAPEQIARWNHLDPRAALQGGMLLQLFLPSSAHPKEVVLIEDGDVDTLTVGSGRFFAHFEGKKGRRRLEVTVRPGDTWKKLSKRYGLSLGMLERINHRSRRSTLHAGDTIVVYSRTSQQPTGKTEPSFPERRRGAPSGVGSAPLPAPSQPEARSNGPIRSTSLPRPLGVRGGTAVASSRRAP